MNEAFSYMKCKQNMYRTHCLSFWS